MAVVLSIDKLDVHSFNFGYEESQNISYLVICLSRYILRHFKLKTYIDLHIL